MSTGLTHAATSGVLTDSAMPTIVRVSAFPGLSVVDDGPPSGATVTAPAPAPDAPLSVAGAEWSVTVEPSDFCSRRAVFPPRTTSPGADHQRPASMTTRSIEASADGAGRPENAWSRIRPPFGCSSAPRITGQGPAAAVTPAAAAVDASWASGIVPSYSTTRCAPLAASNARSNGSWDATSTSSARVAVAAARKRTRASAKDCSRRRRRSANVFVVTAPITRPPEPGHRRRPRRPRAGSRGARAARPSVRHG